MPSSAHSACLCPYKEPMRMPEAPYLVMQIEGSWTVGFGGRFFGRYRVKDDAVLTAVMWAQSAKSKGREVRVLVEESGRIREAWTGAADRKLSPRHPV